MVMPRGRGKDKFCLADTGLPDDDSTPAIRATERDSSAVRINSNIISTAGRVRWIIIAPRETFCEGERPSR